VDVEADRVHVEAGVLGLACPDQLRILVRIEGREIALAVLEMTLVDYHSILRGEAGLRNVRPRRIRMPVVPDAVLGGWCRRSGLTTPTTRRIEWTPEL
jgi:hypothetical protein